MRFKTVFDFFSYIKEKFPELTMDLEMVDINVGGQGQGTGKNTIPVFQAQDWQIRYGSTNQNQRREVMSAPLMMHAYVYGDAYGDICTKYSLQSLQATVGNE